MFEKDYRFWGEHAEMVDSMLIENGGIFDTVYDAFFSAALIGILEGKKSKAYGDRNKHKTIFADKFNNEREKTNLILKTMLLNDNMELKGKNDEKVDRSFRNFATDETTKKMNIKFLEAYAFAGIETLYKTYNEEFLSKDKNKVEIINFIENFMKLYANENEGYQDTRKKIIDMARR